MVTIILMIIVMIIIITFSLEYIDESSRVLCDVSSSLRWFSFLSSISAKSRTHLSVFCPSSCNCRKTNSPAYFTILQRQKCKVVPLLNIFMIVSLSCVFIVLGLLIQNTWLGTSKRRYGPTCTDRDSVDVFSLQ